MLYFIEVFFILWGILEGELIFEGVGVGEVVFILCLLMMGIYVNIRIRMGIRRLVGFLGWS